VRNPQAGDGDVRRQRFESVYAANFGPVLAHHARPEAAGVAACADVADHLVCDGRADRPFVAWRSRAIEHIGLSHDDVEHELLYAGG
jgi:hypothetical protein